MPGNEERIALLLDKTTDFDKDERYMATSDLCTELHKDTELGPFFEPKVCAAVLKQLDDKSNDVQSIAVKCLGILVTKVQETQVADICAKLSDLILHGKPELRDIYSIGLKTILTDVSTQTGAAVASGLCARLLPGLSPDKEQAVKSETLDILTDLLRRFGHDVATEHDRIMALLIAQLHDASPLVRKRATACVGSLGAMATDALLTRLVEHLLAGIRNSSSGASASDAIDVRTFIQTIGTLARTAGHRLGRHLPALVPILRDFCGAPDDEALQTEAANELREHVFQALESFVLRCPSDVTPFVAELLPLALAFVRYDPNYNYGDDDDDDEADGGDEAEPMDEEDDAFSDDDDDDGDYSDDDDTSWKVRRAGLRVLSAVIATRPELLTTLLSTYLRPLLLRFKEREENVRVDVFAVVAELLRATHQTALSTDAAATCRGLVATQRSALVAAANRQFGPKATVATRCAVLAVLTELASVERGELGGALDALLPNVLRAADDKHSDLKLDALVFLRLVVDSHAAAVFCKHMDALVRAAVTCAKSDWYKTVAKALGLIESLVHALAALRADASVASTAQYAGALFDAVLPRLQAHDIDQEIKEAAISCMGQIVAELGDDLGARVRDVYPLLMERLQNEITRVPSMKALAAIARSPRPLDLSPVLADCVVALAQLLRQQSRTLKLATLDALDTLVAHRGAALEPALLADVVTEASALVVDSDLQLCRAGLALLAHTLGVAPALAATDAVRTKAVPQLLTLARSAMLQGPTLAALTALFAQLTTLDAPGSRFDDLIAALLDDDNDDDAAAVAGLSKHAVLNTARCVAAVCVAATTTQRHAAFDRFVAALSTIDGRPTTTADPKQQVVALYALGEFGRQLSLSDGTYTDVQPLLLARFSASTTTPTPSLTGSATASTSASVSGSGSDDVAAAAAYALGSICVGNLTTNLDPILRALEADGAHSYLLLTALREVIADHATSPQHGFTAYVARVVPVLAALSDRDEEAVRNMAAECLGKLASTDAAAVVPVIAELCSAADAPAKRWTGVTSLKFALSAAARPDAIATVVSHIEPFLAALDDADLGVRRAAFLALHTGAHHHSSALAPFVRSRIVPALLTASAIKMERTVDLGPFKHKVDDALALRKAAFACLNTLVAALPTEVETAALLPALAAGLRDQDDVQMLAHQIVVKLCAVRASAVVDALDLLVEPLDKTVSKKIKDESATGGPTAGAPVNGPENERAKDLVRSALRVVDAVSRVRDAAAHPKFALVLERVRTTKALAVQLDAIRAERSGL